MQQEARRGGAMRKDLYTYVLACIFVSYSDHLVLYLVQPCFCVSVFIAAYSPGCCLSGQSNKWMRNMWKNQCLQISFLDFCNQSIHTWRLNCNYLLLERVKKKYNVSGFLSLNTEYTLLNGFLKIKHVPNAHKYVHIFS